MSDVRTPATKAPARLVILISGRGSNMLAIAEACRNGKLSASIALVVSNRPDAAGLESARALGLPTAVVDHSAFATREAFDTALAREVEAARPDWVLLAGFMRILGPTFLDHWPGRILNIHPSLLPKYRGLDTHARAIAAGDREAGASVHIVTAELDAGEVVGQFKVAIEPGDTPASLAARVLAGEHQLYTETLQRLVEADGSGNRANIR